MRSLWLGMSLGHQIFAAMFVSSWAVMSVYFLYDLRSSAMRLNAMERATLDAVAPILRKSVEDAMVSGDGKHLRQLFSLSESGQFAGHLVLLDEGKRGVDVNAIGTGMPPRHSEVPEFDPRSFIILDVPMVSGKPCSRCHGADRGLLGFVRIATPSRGKIDIYADHVRNHAIMFSASMVLMLLWAIYIVRRTIQEPLGRFEEAMGRVAGGSLNARVEGVSGGEFRAIADGFNSMVAELQKDRQEILDLHRRQVAHMERLAALGELSAHLAHEVRNPLTGIGSVLQILQRETPETSPRKEIIGKLLSQLTRMDQTMANFLNFARMPEGKVQPFDLREALGRVFFLLEPRLRSQKVSLERRLTETPLPLIGDPSQIEQVFLNLCLNAVQAMPSGGVLTVSASADKDGWVKGEVTDTGAGIPAEDLERAFRPFFTTREKGSGLGLPISRQIVMAHGGEIWLESGGKGTTASVRLPGPGVPGPGVPLRPGRDSGLPGPGVPGGKETLR